MKLTKKYRKINLNILLNNYCKIFILCQEKNVYKKNIINLDFPATYKSITDIS